MESHTMLIKEGAEWQKKNLSVMMWWREKMKKFHHHHSRRCENEDTIEKKN